MFPEMCSEFSHQVSFMEVGLSSVATDALSLYFVSLTISAFTHFINPSWTMQTPGVTNKCNALPSMLAADTGPA